MKSNFNERREARKEKYEELAQKNLQTSESRYKSARELGQMIPMGQPILVGHHSERGHRAHLNKIDNNMRKSIEADNKASYYASRAAAVDNNRAIFSDDPEALLKLREKLQGLEESQEEMKAVNKICRNKKLSQDEKILKLREKFKYRDNKIINLLAPKYSYEKPGYRSFELTNNNANIRNVRKRIEQLEQAENEESVEILFNDIRILDNVEENRLQIYFPGKPEEEVRAGLKKCGFRWSRYCGCWQRHRSNGAMYDAKKIIGFTK